MRDDRSDCAVALANAEGPLDTEELRLLTRGASHESTSRSARSSSIDNHFFSRPPCGRGCQPRLLGRSETTPGLNLVYAHANRAIRRRDLNACT